jgi:putative ABC transport system permease protein
VRILEAVRLALEQLRVQKLKSFFTLLGVMIGVMFLIAVVSIVTGMQDYLRDDFAGRLLGVNTFTLRSRPALSQPPSDSAARAWSRRPPLHASDIDPVRGAAGSDAHTATSSAAMLYATSPYARPRSVTAGAVEGDYFEIKNLELAAGRAFTPQEQRIGTPVIVIGAEIATYFFPNLDPLDRELRVNDYPFRVIGVLKTRGTVFGISLDQIVVAPLRSRMGRVTGIPGTIGGIVVQAATPEALDEAEQSVRRVMRARHQLSPTDADDFVLETAESALTQFRLIMTIASIAGAIFPPIGIVVGGIVIMNIMLVSVAERTREIGIRKALGARRRDIMRQFLVESATLSTIGAMIGIALGIGAAKLVAANTPLPASIAYWSVVAATLLGTVVGIVAGAYPASRAAKLDPIDALGRE